ncbi:conjugal transfer protein TraD [Hephaestia sp. CMS5P-6]|nr:conjugal transfer protein TraD [Hephaestia mangrovi]MBY8826582.1 conjugal transfer protein TraD [Hephaestia mangrovi]
MRKPRDFDAELKALDERARNLKQRKVQQLGDLVIATGADALDIEVLAGALLDAANRNDLTIREEWRRAGDAFFRDAPRGAARGPHSRARSGPPRDGGAQSSAGDARPS